MAEKQHITKTFEYKIRTNKKFVEAAISTLGASRFVYNCALEHRIRYYQATGKTVNYYEQSRQLTEARKALPEVRKTLRTIQADALERLDFAFNAFFRRLKAGEKPGFPRFKSHDRYDTFSQKIEKERKCPLVGDKLTVPGVGTCRVRLSRPIEGKVKQLRITRRADGWYALLICDIPKQESLPRTGCEVGIDMGIECFATLSTGEQIPNPRHLKQAEEKLRQRHRILSRRKKGSQNRTKQRHKVALTYLKVQRSRKDAHFKLAARLVKENDRIVVEDLNIKGMVQNRHLAKAISDVGWGSFINILTHKAEDAGKQVVKVNPKNTSQECSGCGAIVKKSLSVRTHKCECGLILHRDHNAAINILRRGTPEVTPVESASMDSLKQEQRKALCCQS